MKTGIIILVVVIAAVAAYLVFGRGKNTIVENSPTPEISATVTPTPSVKSSPTPTPSQSVIVTYTDSGFSPSRITIKKGQAVIFKNNASDAVRIASDPHPQHNGYPTTGGCVSSTFDSCQNVSPGGSWSFKFDIAGTWGYHNHLDPAEKGTVVVNP